MQPEKLEKKIQLQANLNIAQFKRFLISFSKISIGRVQQDQDLITVAVFNL